MALQDELTGCKAAAAAQAQEMTARHSRDQALIDELRDIVAASESVVKNQSALVRCQHPRAGVFPFVTVPRGPGITEG